MKEDINLYDYIFFKIWKGFQWNIKILVSVSQKLPKVHFYFPSSFSSLLLDYSVMICALYSFVIEVLLKIKIKYSWPGGLNTLNDPWIMAMCVLQSLFLMQWNFAHTL